MLRICDPKTTTKVQPYSTNDKKESVTLKTRPSEVMTTTSEDVSTHKRNSTIIPTKGEDIIRVSQYVMSDILTETVGHHIKESKWST